VDLSLTGHGFTSTTDTVVINLWVKVPVAGCNTLTILIQLCKHAMTVSVFHSVHLSTLYLKLVGGGRFALPKP
jgi:hypothetical protein